MIELDLGIKSIDKIYHISDIHLRNFKRHAEYRRVLDTVINQISKTKTENSLICLTGDIVHSKNDITPELVQEVTYLLNRLAEQLPVLMIPGNHDANLKNNQRLDSLSPIVTAIGNSRVFYIKDSGVYKIADLHFIHWSVFDSEDKYIKPADIDAKVKIGLYHGPVKAFNAVNATEYMTNFYSYEDFKGFDMVLLGDLHSFHYLNPEESMAYPGSLIQQNHGESLDHGFLIWDVNSKKAEYVKVDNDTAYYTLDVEDGGYNEIPDEIPNKLYLRLRYKNTSNTVLNSIVESIRQDREIIELSQQKLNTFEIGNYKASHKSLIDVKDVTQQNTLLSDFLKNKLKLEAEEIEAVCNLNEEINHSIRKTDTAKNTYWSPRKFEFSNMFSYGEGNVIDFNKMNGTYGVFAPNASGKSSLLAAIEYCIFDKCSKTSKAAQVMNNNANYFDCKLEFELNGNVHVIERKAKRSKDTVKVDVEFYYYDNEGGKVSLNGKERSDTNSNIRNLLGNHEDFVLTSMSVQGNNTGFIDMGQSDRKNLLAQFLDISIFDSLYTIANDKVKECSVLVKEYKKFDYANQLEEFAMSTQYYSNEFRNLQDNKDDLDKSIQEYNDNIMQLKSSLVEIDSSIIELQPLLTKKSRFESQIQESKRLIPEIENKIHDIESTVTSIESEVNSINSHKIDEGITQLNHYVEHERSLSIEVERLKTTMISKLEKMEKLKELKYDENCAFCMDNVFVKDAIATKESIKDTEQIARTKVQELRDVKDKLKELSTFKDQKERLDNLKLQLYRAKSTQSEARLLLSQKNNQLNECQGSIEKVESDIVAYYEKEASINNNKLVQSKIQEVWGELGYTKNKLSEVESKIADCISNLQITQKSKDAIDDSLKKLERLEQDYKLYGHYATAMHKDGIPYTIISTIIPILEEDINNILSQVVDFRISIKSDGKNINASIVYDDSRVWPIELASGMEKFISSIAIRTALVNICSLPRPNFLAIDEGFGVMDLDNMSNVSILMDYLKSQFKFILIISHIDSIKDVVDNQIEVVKDKKATSKVRYL